MQGALGRAADAVGDVIDGGDPESQMCSFAGINETDFCQAVASLMEGKSEAGSAKAWVKQKESKNGFERRPVLAALQHLAKNLWESNSNSNPQAKSNETSIPFQKRGKNPFLCENLFGAKCLMPRRFEKISRRSGFSAAQYTVVNTREMETLQYRVAFHPDTAHSDCTWTHLSP